jgi:hypothetical protein
LMSKHITFEDFILPLEFAAKATDGTAIRITIDAAAHLEDADLFTQKFILEPSKFDTDQLAKHISALPELTQVINADAIPSGNIWAAANQAATKIEGPLAQLLRERGLKFVRILNVGAVKVNAVPQYSGYSGKSSFNWKYPAIVLAVLLVLVGGGLGYALSSTSTKLDNTQNTLTATQAELGTTKTILTGTQTDLATANTNLASTQAQLNQTQTTLASTQSQLTSSQSKLNDTQSQLTSTQNSLATANSSLASAQSQLSSANSSLSAAQGKLTTATGEISKVQAYLKVLTSWDAPTDTLAQTNTLVRATNDAVLTADFNNVMNTWSAFSLNNTQSNYNNYMNACESFDTDLASDISNILAVVN